MIIGPAQLDRAEHGGQLLGAVTDELGLVPLPAVDARPAMPVFALEQLFQEYPADAVHRFPDFKFDGPQVHMTQSAPVLEGTLH